MDCEIVVFASPCSEATKIIWSMALPAGGYYVDLPTELLAWRTRPVLMTGLGRALA